MTDIIPLPADSPMVIADKQRTCKAANGIDGRRWEAGTVPRWRYANAYAAQLRMMGLILGNHVLIAYSLR